jgi:hypothetical protein
MCAQHDLNRFNERFSLPNSYSCLSTFHSIRPRSLPRDHTRGDYHKRTQPFQFKMPVHRFDNRSVDAVSMDEAACPIGCRAAAYMSWRIGENLNNHRGAPNGLCLLPITSAYEGIANLRILQLVAFARRLDRTSMVTGGWGTNIGAKTAINSGEEY